MNKLFLQKKKKERQYSPVRWSRHWLTVRLE